MKHVVGLKDLKHIAAHATVILELPEAVILLSRELERKLIFLALNKLFTLSSTDVSKELREQNG